MEFLDGENAELYFPLAFFTEFDELNGDKKPDETPIFHAWNKAAIGLCLFTWSKPKEGGEMKPRFDGLSYNGIFRFLNDNGFYKRYREEGDGAPPSEPLLIREQNGVIYEVIPANIRDFISGYLDTLPEETVYSLPTNTEILYATVNAEALRERWKAASGSICNYLFLGHLETHKKEVVKDTISTTWKFFKNTALRITADGATQIPYVFLANKCVWRSQIKQRNFELLPEDTDGGFYETFLRNICNNENDRFNSFQSAIGYALNSYNSPSQGLALLCYDEIIQDLHSPSGGTGKGLFTKSLALHSDAIFLDGKKFDQNDRFSFQRYRDSTQIMVLEDLSPKTPFSRFHSVLTDGFSVERKNREEQRISPEKSPKLIITSNSILANEGTTNTRRQFILEFSDHYSKQTKAGIMEPIREEFGCVFFADDFPKEQWRRFDNFMVKCCVRFLKNGLERYEPKSVKLNRVRQICGEEFAEFIAETKLEIGKEYVVKDIFNAFKALFFADDEKYKQTKFTQNLRKYASAFGLNFESRASNGNIFFRFRK